METQRYREKSWFKRCVSYASREKECHDLLDETIVIIFAELTRFHKTEDECVTLEDKLMYLLKNSGNMKTPSKWATEKPCKDLLDAFEIDDFSKTKRSGPESGDFGPFDFKCKIISVAVYKACTLHI